jgi:hypothetical protein
LNRLWKIFEPILKNNLGARSEPILYIAMVSLGNYTAKNVNENNGFEKIFNLNYGERLSQ